MNEITVTQQTVAISSMEVAERTGKQHKHVLTDIRKMLEDLGLRSADFSADLLDTYGRTQPGFVLPRREALILATGYSAVLRAKLIDRLEELEQEARAPVQILNDATEVVAQVAFILQGDAKAWEEGHQESLSDYFQRKDSTAISVLKAVKQYLDANPKQYTFYGPPMSMMEMNKPRTKAPLLKSKDKPDLLTLGGVLNAVTDPDLDDGVLTFGATGQVSRFEGTRQVIFALKQEIKEAEEHLTSLNHKLTDAETSILRLIGAY